jgi:hypothetical protein
METSACSPRLGGHLTSQNGALHLDLFPHLSSHPHSYLYATQYELERRKYAQDLISFDKRFSALFSEKLRVDSEGHGPTQEEFIG